VNKLNGKITNFNFLKILYSIIKYQIFLFFSSKALELNQMLLTSAMREKLTKRPVKKYEFTLIRIKFPNDIILQGTFEVKENLEEVVKFIKEHLSNTELPFNLITDARQMVTEKDFGLTLETLNFVPATIFTFSCNSDSKETSQFLKEETLNLLQSL
jgi:UBX domain-containing protein 6